MAAPGTTISVVAAASTSTIDIPTGRCMAVGLTERGPVGTPVLIHSLADYTALLGQRVTYGNLYDFADCFFHEGGSSLYVSRIVGPAATTATLALKDRASVTPLNTLTVSAIGAGLDGNNTTVAVTNGTPANTFVLTIADDGVTVEVSPPLSSPSQAVAWSASSHYVRITDAGSTTAAPNNNPAVLAATALTGGADDNANAGTTQYTAGLAAISPNYGPGQVCCPGQTGSPVHDALLNHAQANNRVALLDAPDTPTAATIETLAASDQAGATDPSYGTMLAPWTAIPGLPTGTSAPPYPRPVPPSALVAGLIARSDATHDVDVAAAGANGQAQYCQSVSQTYVASDLDGLNAAGVSVIRDLGIPGAPAVTLYGWQSLATDPNWQDLSTVRLRSGIIAALQATAAGFEFSQLDGQGHTIAAFNGALVATLAPFWTSGALYGATANQAFVVNTGPQVNTPTTAAARQLVAEISLRMSPSAEFVTISVVKQPTTVSLT